MAHTATSRPVEARRPAPPGRFDIYGEGCTRACAASVSEHRRGRPHGRLRPGRDRHRDARAGPRAARPLSCPSARREPVPASRDGSAAGRDRLQDGDGARGPGPGAGGAGNGRARGRTGAARGAGRAVHGGSTTDWPRSSPRTLAHMHDEETSNNAVLWATHGDEALAEIQQAIVASMRPETMAAFIRWMVPAMSPAERGAARRHPARCAARGVRPRAGGRAAAPRGARVDEAHGPRSAPLPMSQ